ncbi:MAG: hypothetical protein GTO30_15615, partial [Acidobacteria bacterium]|nr:hypothetical protein [Acidobacteriota bacterium]NIQ86115.1 hypothetical protein [Acidobacteriota bacterium]
YTQSLREVDLGGGNLAKVVSDDSITRGMWGAGLEIVGPKFYRVFDRPDSPFS